MVKLYVVANRDSNNFVGPVLKTQEIADIHGKMPFEVKIVSIEDFMRNTPTDGVVLPYFRTKPSLEQDVLRIIGNNVPVINDYRTWADDWSMKYEANKHAELHGIPSPKTELIVSDQDFDSLEFGYPIVIKGYPSGQGSDVHLCHSREEATTIRSTLIEKGLSVLAQEYIAESHGRDLRVLMVDKKIVHVLERRGGTDEHGNLNFLSHVARGGAYITPELSTADYAVIAKAASAFQVDLAGFDFLFTPEGLQFSEINLAPSWGGKASDVLTYLAELTITKASTAASKPSPSGEFRLGPTTDPIDDKPNRAPKI